MKRSLEYNFFGLYLFKIKNASSGIDTNPCAENDSGVLVGQLCACYDY